MPLTPCFCYEVAHLPPDPVSGAAISRLTSAAAVSSNIYCEQPYSSPDGHRVAIVRSADFNRDWPWCDLVVADLPSRQLAYAQRGIQHQVVNTAWGEAIYYWKPDGRFYRLSLLSLEETVVADGAGWPRINCGLSISPDERYLVYGTAIPGPTAAAFGIVRVELARGTWDLIFRHPDLVNPHTMFEPTHGRDILVQQNLNPVSRPDGAVTSLGTGALLVMIDRDGGHYRQLRVGPPVTSECTGHQTFIPGQDRVALTVNEPHDLPALAGGPGARGRGNFLTIAPGDDGPRVFDAPGQLFGHVSVSRCGRYFICDAYTGRLGDPIPLVVGCFATGRARPLLQDCHGSHGPCQFGHPHAYLTADNRHAIFNSERHGPGQVYAATVPDGFLASLA